MSKNVDINNAFLVDITI